MSEKTGNADHESDNESSDEEYVPEGDVSEESEEDVGSDSDLSESEGGKPRGVKRKHPKDAQSNESNKQPKLSDLPEEESKEKVKSLLEEFKSSSTSQSVSSSISKPIPSSSSITSEKISVKSQASPVVLPLGKATKVTPSVKSALDILSGSKKKTSILNQSKDDWKFFLDKEGIEDELSIHNRGKEGFLEKKAFEQRTDLRQFEIEKTLRWKNRPK